MSRVNGSAMLTPNSARNSRKKTVNSTMFLFFDVSLQGLRTVVDNVLTPSTKVLGNGRRAPVSRATEGALDLIIPVARCGGADCLYPSYHPTGHSPGPLTRTCHNEPNRSGDRNILA